MPRFEAPNPQTLTEHFEAFFTAVDVKEPLVVCIFAYHLAVLVLVVCFRQGKLVTSLTSLQLLICFQLTSINQYLGSCWQTIASQNYFDSNGLFVSVTIGFPCLVNSGIATVFALYNTSKDLKKAFSKKYKSN